MDKIKTCIHLLILNPYNFQIIPDAIIKRGIEKRVMLKREYSTILFAIPILSIAKSEWSRIIRAIASPRIASIMRIRPPLRAGNFMHRIINSIGLIV
jgi:hypothetical protein